MTMDCYCDYDAPEYYRLRLVKAARKQHRCEECGRAILPGERYENVHGKWEGAVSTLKTCANCLDIRQFVANSVPCFCWAHGNMLDEARDAIQDAYWRAGDEVKGLFMGYGRLVIAGRRKRTEIREPRP